MIIECSAIILIILLMSFTMGRHSQKNGWSLGVLPLVIVPFGHICGMWLDSPLGRLLGISEPTAWIGVDLASLVMTCLFIGLIAANIKKRRSRMSYLVICGGYSMLLTCVLIVRSIII